MAEKEGGVRPLHPVWGHEELRRSLARARSTDALPGSLLLHGPPGAGKQRLGLWIGQLLLCEEVGPEGPCDACRACRLALRLEHPDLHWHFPLSSPRSGPTEKQADELEEARAEGLRLRRARPIGVHRADEPRGIYMAAVYTLRRQVTRRPAMADRQIFLVAESELLVPQAANPEAANALLKLLEEPPAGTWIVLTSDAPGRLLPTIRSRTLPLHVPPLPREDVERFLVDEAGVEAEAAEKAASLSGGSIGRALGFLPDADDDRSLDTARRDAFRILQAALDPRPGAGFRRALHQKPAGARGLAEELDLLEGWLRDLAAVAAGSDAPLLNPDAREALEKLATGPGGAGVSPAALARGREAVEEARGMARGNVNPQLLVAGLVRDLRRTLIPEDAGVRG